MAVFAEKYKKIILIGFAAIVVILSACILPSAINNAILTARVQKYFDGKMFIRVNGIWTTAYSFDGNKMGKESWCSTDQYSGGDVGEMLPYKVKGDLGSNKVKLWYKDDGKWWSSTDLILYADGTVAFNDGEWRLATESEIDTTRKETLCKHEFGQDVILKASTCSSQGEVSHTCKKCNYTETVNTTTLEHNYQNKVCTVCGAKKVPEKAYNVEPNTWYVYNNVLYFQNCKLLSATSVSQGSAMMVQYRAVCQDCHCVEEFSKLAGPEVNYEVKKVYYCSECGAQTLVRMKIE